LLLGIGLQQNAEGRRRQQPTPPEVKKTTDSIIGKWSGQLTAKVGPSPPESFNWTMDCTPIAFGAGALSNNEGKASIGPLSPSCLRSRGQGRTLHVCNFDGRGTRSQGAMEK